VNQHGLESRATQHLAEFVAALKYENLPFAVGQRLTALLVDYFRVGSVGTSLSWVAKLREGLSTSFGPPVAAILYGDTRTDPARAAYLNGVIAGSLEWDDTHVGAMLHPGVVVWPAALAIGQMTRASRQEIMTAAAAGYEAMIRIGLAVQPSHFLRGYQSTATCGVFGAAVAAAKLLGLDVTGIRNAIGIAGSYAGGVTQFFLSGSEVKRLHAGKAAAAGVEAALFAQAGLSGPPDIIEGTQGFAAAQANEFDPDQIIQGLGETFHLMRLQLKPHAVSARVLAAIEAAEILAAEGVVAGIIEKVVVGIPKVIMGRLTNCHPQDLQQAQMSVPFAVAMTLSLAQERQGALVISVEDCEAALAQDEIRALAAKVQCEIDPEMERISTTEYVSARVTVHLQGGQIAEKVVPLPLGCPERPMTATDLRDRFQAVAERRISTTALTHWFGIVGNDHIENWAEEVMGLRLTDTEGGQP
jgi:2-methylcitrate dehydratase PrpD